MSERLTDEELPRLLELSARLVAAGPKASHVSASECHEISDGMDELITELRARRSADLSPEDIDHIRGYLDECSEPDAAVDVPVPSIELLTLLSRLIGKTS